MLTNYCIYLTCRRVCSSSTARHSDVVGIGQKYVTVDVIIRSDVIASVDGRPHRASVAGDDSALVGRVPVAIGPHLSFRHVDGDDWYFLPVPHKIASTNFSLDCQA